MMQAFRNSARPIIVILTVAFVGWLVFDLSGLSGGTGLLTQTSVGKIEGRSVDSRVYQEAVQAAIENEQRASGTSLGLEGLATIRDQVWEQFISATLLEREYERRGIRTNAAEIAETIRNVPLPEMQQNPDMLTDGQFDPAKYQRWLNSAVGQQYIPLLENRYRDEILRSKLFRALVADVSVSDPGLWERFRDENEMAQVGVLRIDPATSVPETAAQVSPEEVAAYYRENRESFRQPRRAWLSYVSLPRLPLASDTAAAYQRALAIRTELVGGAPFAEVASRESADEGSAAQGGDLGEWTRGRMNPEFQAMADRVPLNTLSEPFLTPEGYHLLEVTSKVGDTFRGRHILIRVEVTGEHRDRLDAQADSLEALGADRLDGTALDTLSRALGLPIGQTGQVNEGQRVLAGSVSVPDAGAWAFLAEEGETSPVIEAGPAFYVFRVDSLAPEGIPALEQVRSEVEAAVRARKQAEAAAQIAAEIRQQATSGTSLSQIAAQRGLDYSEPAAFSRLAPLVQGPELSGAAFALAPGELSGPVTSQGAIWLMQGISRTPADSSRFAAELPTLRARELQMLRQQRIREYLGALRLAARITDRRADLYRTDAQAEAAAVPAPVGQPARRP